MIQKEKIRVVVMQGYCLLRKALVERLEQEYDESHGGSGETPVASESDSPDEDSESVELSPEIESFLEGLS